MKSKILYEIEVYDSKSILEKIREHNIEIFDVSFKVLKNPVYLAYTIFLVLKKTQKGAIYFRFASSFAPIFLIVLYTASIPPSKTLVFKRSDLSLEVW